MRNCKQLIINLIFLSFLYNTSFSQVHENIDFIPPLKIPLYLSGTYAELRTNHFHSGIDIKTQGRKGLPIYAIEEGYVYRIKIRITGYGKTLYLNHPNGFTSVYGHLDHFSPKIEAYVKNLQYEQRSYEINDFPNKNELKIDKGEIIAYSGNSGYSFGPHLHFEIRETKTEIPVNPLEYYNIPDTVSPKIYSLFIYPHPRKSYFNVDNESIKFQVFKNRNQYKLFNDTISFYSDIQLGIEVFDFLNNSRNKCGINSLELIVNDEQLFYAELNNIPFNETRYINSYMDYANKVENNYKIHKLYKDPNNKVSVYQNIINNGIIRLQEDEISEIKIIAKDINNNSSQLNFFIKKSEVAKNINSNSSECLKLIDCFKEEEIVKNDIKIYFPENTFYDTICFNYAKMEMVDQNFDSPVYYIHNISVPVHKKYKLSINPVKISEKLRNKAVICRLEEDEEEDDRFDEFESMYQDSFIVAYPNSLGKFVLIVDTLQPKILPHNFINKSYNDFSKKDRIEFKVVDEISGIMSYNGFIDDKWVLFEYDKKNDLLFYIFDDKRLEYKKNHQLKLIVSDNKNNIEIFETSFYK